MFGKKGQEDAFSDKPEESEKDKTERLARAKIKNDHVNYLIAIENVYSMVHGDARNYEDMVSIHKFMGDIISSDIIKKIFIQ
jgi:hypothetical protein